MVFDQQGEIVGRDSTPEAEREVGMESMRPGDRYFIAFTDADGRQYPEGFRTAFEIARNP